MCRGPKNSPTYRRCLSSIPASQGGTRGLRRADAAKVKAAIAAGEALDPRDDLGDAMARAEADAAAHAAWLATDPTPLEQELGQIGLSGLAERYGFDHAAFDARFLRLDDLADLDIPGTAPAPTLPTRAGSLGAIVVKPAVPGSTWNPLHGLSVTWHGQGDEGERARFAVLLGSWFTSVFDALRGRFEHRHVSQHGV